MTASSELVTICPDYPTNSHAQSPIPEYPNVKGWQEIPLTESGEPLVDLRNIPSDGLIIVESQYLRMGYVGARLEQFCRAEVSKKLVEAAQLLPQGMKLKVLDAWRPLELQQDIFDRYLQTLAMANGHLSVTELVELCLKFVSLPSDNPTRPSPHYTGGSIDLTLTNEVGEEMWMGTAFDDFSEKASTHYFENPDHVVSSDDECARNNRRLLFHVMSGVGFTNYMDEWWHFDFGNQFWGKLSGKEAFYGPATPQSNHQL